jgi:mannose-1-phosphate guanylyltransferase
MEKPRVVIDYNSGMEVWTLMVLIDKLSQHKEKTIKTLSEALPSFD